MHDGQYGGAARLLMESKYNGLLVNIGGQAGCLSQ